MGEAGHGKFQFFRVRRQGLKESCLRRTRARGVGGQRNLQDRGCGRVRLQMQAKQLQEHFGIAHGHGQGHGFFIGLRSCLFIGRVACLFFQARGVIFEGGIEFKARMNGIGGKGACIQAGAELVEQAPQDERQRLQLLDGIFQLHFLFKTEARLSENQRTHARAAGEFVQANAILSQALR